jgi:hypothetical protein
MLETFNKQLIEIRRESMNSLNSTINRDSYKYTTYLINIPEIKKSIKRFGKKLITNLRKRKKGHGELIFIAFLYFIVGYLLIAPPINNTVRNLKFTLVNSQLNTANDIGTALNSPVRKRIVYEVYKSVQAQLVSHLQQAAGSQPYACQGQYVDPTKTDPVTGVTTGDLSYQYGLCSPETLLSNLGGDTNQSLNLISGMYPDYQKVLSTPENDRIRQATIKDSQNDYNYTLRSTYVGEAVLSQGPSATVGNRFEQYHYSVRADVEYFTYRYTKVRSPLVIYYDVFISNNFYVGPFYGGGGACDQTTTYTNSCGTDAATGQPISCIPAMVQQPNGSWAFAVQFGDDDPQYQPVPGSCREVNIGGLSTIQCDLTSGGRSREFKPRGIRMQTGCASASTGVLGVTSPDNNGYGFVISVRTVSYGKNYS